MSTAKAPNDGVRHLSREEIEVVTGAGISDIFRNIGCIVISRWLPMPTDNPWLDPYSPERRGS